MSTNVVHFLTVPGVAAKQVTDACGALLARAVYDEDPRFPVPEWSDADAAAIEALARSLLARSLLAQARALPVVHYSSYIDGWSMCNWMLDFAGWPDERRLVLAGLNYAVAYFPSRLFVPRRPAIARARRTKAFRQGAEFRLFLTHLDEALAAGGWLECEFVVVAVTECFGGSREDDEILSSLDQRLTLDG